MNATYSITVDDWEVARLLGALVDASNHGKITQEAFNAVAYFLFGFAHYPYGDMEPEDIVKSCKMLQSSIDRLLVIAEKKPKQNQS